MPTSAPGRHSKALSGNLLQNHVPRTRFSRLVVQRMTGREARTRPGPATGPSAGRWRAPLRHLRRPGSSALEPGRPRALDARARRSRPMTATMPQTTQNDWVKTVLFDRGYLARIRGEAIKVYLAIIEACGGLP